jgi:hypothetical protein
MVKVLLTPFTGLVRLSPKFSFLEDAAPIADLTPDFSWAISVL